MNGRQIAETWLGNVISDLGYEVYRQPAPLNAPYPHITISLRSGMDIRPVNAPATAERLTYDISAWNEGTDSSGLFPMSAAIQAAIDGADPVTVTGGTILGCRRIGVVPIDSIVENGEHFVRDGYLYEVFTLSS
jgi:hypothetical protein